MSRMITGGLLASLVLCSFAAVGVAQDDPPKPKPKDKKKTWAVIQQGDDLKVVDEKTIPEIKKQITADHKRDVKRWEEAKKLAKKEKRKFTEKKPRKVKLKTIKGRFKTEEKAKEFLDAYRKKREKRRGD